MLAQRFAEARFLPARIDTLGLRDFNGHEHNKVHHPDRPDRLRQRQKLAVLKQPGAA